MAFAVLPDGTVKVMSTEAYGRFKMDDNFTPHVTMERAKMRILAFEKKAESLPAGVNATWTEQRLLLTHIPAGRTRVLWNMFTLANTGSALPAANIEVGSYISNLPNAFAIIPEANITSAAFTASANSLTTLTAAQVPVADIIGKTFISKEDIAVCLYFSAAQTMTALAAMAFFGQLVYLQE